MHAVAGRAHLIFLPAGATMVAAPGARAQSSGASHPTPAPIRVTWLAHAGFEVVSSGGTRLLIDPWTVIVPMQFGTQPPPFSTEREVREAFPGDTRLRVLVPGREVAFEVPVDWPVCRP